MTAGLPSFPHSSCCESRPRREERRETKAAAWQAWCTESLASALGAGQHSNPKAHRGYHNNALTAGTRVCNVTANSECAGEKELARLRYPLLQKNGLNYNDKRLFWQIAAAVTTRWLALGYPGQVDLVSLAV
jgi:hypothetical protein